MSRPRYKWWSYVKWCIRDYPNKCAELAEMKRLSYGNALDGISHSGLASRTTEQIATRSFSGQKEREYEGVRKAVEETRRMEDGSERLRMVEMVFWKNTHTLQGAALACHISRRTMERWHGDFIRIAAKHMGLLD